MNATNNSGVAPHAALATLRATAAALIAAPIVLAVVLMSMNLDGDGPPAWALAVGPLATLAGVVLAQVAGYPGHRRLDGELSGTRWARCCPTFSRCASGSRDWSGIFGQATVS